MDLLFGGDTSLLTKASRKTKAEMLAQAADLWYLEVSGEPFDADAITLLQYTEGALIPGLSSHETKAIAVAKSIKQFATDTCFGRKTKTPGGMKDRRTKIIENWSALEGKSLVGVPTPDQDAHCESSADVKRRITALSMNTLLFRHILKRLPEDLFQGGVIYTLLVSNPSWIRKQCDFFCEKWDFFGQNKLTKENVEALHKSVSKLHSKLEKSPAFAPEGMAIVVSGDIQLASLKAMLDQVDH